MTLNERLMAIVEFYGTTVAAFERSCGLSNGFVKNATENVGASKIKNILRTYPNISALWLITGLGSMLNDSDISTDQSVKSSGEGKFSNTSSNDSDKMISIFQAELNKKDEQIDRLINLLEHIVYQRGNYDFIPSNISPESRQK